MDAFRDPTALLYFWRKTFEVIDNSKYYQVNTQINEWTFAIFTNSKVIIGIFSQQLYILIFYELWVF